MSGNSEISKYLSKDQLMATLPNYKNIFNEIYNIRKLAPQFSSFTKSAYDHFPYKNVISILGERGSGKSTVFNTIKNIIGQKIPKATEKYELDNSIEKILNEQDVNLDVIVPEMLEDSSDVLGVMLLNINEYLKNNKNKIDEYYKSKLNEKSSRNEIFENCIYSKKNKLEEMIDNVFKIYIQRKSNFDHMISKNFSGINDYSEEKRASLLSDIKLADYIYDFFNEMIKVFGEQVLIYFYFDDVDINSRRCNEVLKTVLRYLKHPNVVIFLSGDINKFHEALLIEEMYYDGSYKIEEKLKLENSKKISESKKILVYEFLKKIMPYPNRYNLIKLSDTEKQNFKYVYSNGESKQFYQLLNEKFLNEKKEDKDNFVKSVYRIFDDKPRGIISVWEYIEKNFAATSEFDDNKNEKNILKFSNDAAKYKNLLEIIIDTNQRFDKYRKFIVEDLILIVNKESKEDKQITKAAGVNLEINYDRLISRIKMGKLSIEEKEEYLTILALIYFIEKIIYYNNKNNTGTRMSYKSVSDVLNILASTGQNYKVYPCVNDIDKILELYSKLNENIPIDEQGKIYENDKYFKIFYKIVVKLWSQDKNSNLRIENEDYEFCLNIYDRNKNLDDQNEQSKLYINEKILNEFEEFDFDMDLLSNSNESKEIKEDELKKLEQYELLIIKIRKMIFCIDKLNVENNDDGKKEKKDYIIYGKKVWQLIDEYREYIAGYIDIRDLRVLKKIETYKDESNVKVVEQIDRSIYIMRNFLTRYKMYLKKNESIYNRKILKNRIDSKKIYLLETSEFERKGKNTIIESKKNFDSSNYRENNKIINKLNPINSILMNINSESNFCKLRKDRENLFEIWSNINTEFPLSTETKIANYVSWYQNYRLCKELEGAYESFKTEWNEFKLISILQYEQLVSLETCNNELKGYDNKLNNMLTENTEDKYKELIVMLKDFEKRIDNKIKLLIDEDTTNLYKIKRTLKLKIDDLKDIYDISTIDLIALNKIIKQLSNLELKRKVNNLKNLLIKEGRVSKEEFDDIILNIKNYFNDLKVSSNEEKFNYFYFDEIEKSINKILKEDIVLVNYSIVDEEDEEYIVENKKIESKYNNENNNEYKSIEELDKRAKKLLYEFELKSLIKNYKEKLEKVPNSLSEENIEDVEEYKND